MPFYHRLGQIPPKRHQVLPKGDDDMHFEQLMGNKGFVGPSTLMYHLRYPTQVLDQRHVGSLPLVAIDDPRARAPALPHFRGPPRTRLGAGSHAVALQRRRHPVLRESER